MDGGRPGWLDSINGIPSLFGASTCECFQLLRAVRMTGGMLAELNPGDDFFQPLPVEVEWLVRQLMSALREFASGDPQQRDFAYWDITASAREAYREKVRFGFDGGEKPFPLADLRRFLELAEDRLVDSISRSVDPKTGVPVTYVIHEAVAYEPIMDADPSGKPIARKNAKGYACVKVNKFKPHFFPLFLEAPFHAMTVETDHIRARKLYQATRNSPLFDQKLKMYLTTDSVADESCELGRIWAWPAGWFENENIFLHMEHKYLLSTLRAGLFSEYYEDFKNCLIPFQPVDVYGRNPLENSSFIVSSRHPRPAHHGRGYLPRSSGTTAEVLNMLLWMSFGQKPFALLDGRLQLRFQPALPAWIFTRSPAKKTITHSDGSTTQADLPANSFSIMFLGKILATFINPSGKSTFGPAAANITGYHLFYADGRQATINGPVIPDPLANDVRDGNIRRMEVIME
jgi:hypothetical protein